MSSGYCWASLTWPDTACASEIKSEHQPRRTAQGGTRNPLPAHAGHLCHNPNGISLWPQNCWDTQAAWATSEGRSSTLTASFVWFPPLSTWSAPDWAISITHLGITIAALVVTYQTLLSCLHSPNSFGMLIAPWIFMPPLLHTPGHISPLQCLLKPYFPNVKWDSPFLTSAFRSKGVFEARKNLRGLREEKLCIINIHFYRSQERTVTRAMYLSNWWLCTCTNAALLHLSILQEWDNFSHTCLWRQFSEFGFVHLSYLWS